jgi:hypothetical protein
VEANFAIGPNWLAIKKKFRRHWVFTWTPTLPLDQSTGN